MIFRALIGIVLVAMGLLKLGDMFNIVEVDWLWQQPWTAYVAPVATVWLGLNFIFHRSHKHEQQFLQRPVPSTEEGKRIVCRTRYGGDEYIYHGETFHGASLDVFCGAIRLDLRNAAIVEDEEIDIHNTCGGVELIVPQTVNVSVQSHSFMGGIENQALGTVDPSKPTLHIVASNFMSGISIKN